MTALPLKRINIVWLLLAFLIQGCAANSPFDGHEAKKPIFRADPTLAALRPEARFPGAGDAPKPGFRRATTILIAEATGTVYNRTSTQIMESVNGYTLIVSKGVGEVRCNPETVTKAVTQAGIMDYMAISHISSPRCPNIGDSLSRTEIVEVTNVSGRLFPLAVGNMQSYSYRELLKIDDGRWGNPDTGVSNRELSVDGQYEVVERLESYPLSNGKDVGEVFIIRQKLVLDKSAEYIFDLYYSTALGWLVFSRMHGGDLTVKLVNWQ